VVRTAAVAALLGIEPQSLRARRCWFDALPYRRLGRHAVYDLRDVRDVLTGVDADGRFER